MSKTEWVMTVPVISTAHLSGPNELDRLSQMFQVARTDCGGLIQIGLGGTTGEPAYISDIRRWLLRNYGDKCSWLRFDRDAEVMDDLEDFTYVWEAMGKP